MSTLIDPVIGEIVIGRENFIKFNTSDDLIVIDYLVAVPLSNGEKFDGNDEVMSIGTLNRYKVTILCVGDNASSNQSKIRLMIRSQRSRELQRQLGIRVGSESNFRNLKELHGTIRDDSFEMELDVDIYEDIDIDTLRIDTAVININSE